MNTQSLSWFGIFRLGLVQASLGAVVVLTTVTLNRVMVIELSLPAILPGALVALHYAVQVLRPRLGFGSDVGGRRTPWILGGMALLALGGIGAAAATEMMAQHRLAGILLAVPAFVMVGVGVGSAGTSLLVLMAKQVAPQRRGAAATILWMLMILGIALTATIAGKMLHPFSLPLLLVVAAKIAGAALLISCLAVWGVEQRVVPVATAQTAQPRFMTALREVWEEPKARRFAIFVFISMLAYSAQELILEPFAGAVFALSPGLTAGLTGLQHGGVMVGMCIVAAGSFLAGAGRLRAMRLWTVGGCLASAMALLALAAAGLVGPAWPLKTTVFVLGAANGAFAVSAIGAMMGLANQGRGAREGVRMGLWGAAQALAFGAGGLLGTASSDVFRTLIGAPAPAYAVVFLCQAALFLAAARLAGGIFNAEAGETAELRSTPSTLKEIAA
jgi:BCD family chlorophyll transporter-like MFS transporter